MASNPHETIWPEKLGEAATAQIAFIVRDELGLSPGTLGALTLTIYNRTTGAVINGRDAANILNANGGTYSYDVPTQTGTVTLQMDPTDNALEVPGADQEVHIALFRWTYATSKKGWHRIVLTIAGDPKVT